MSGEINRVPIGLLSLLDMAARGQAPRLLDGAVQAGVDLLPFYCEQQVIQLDNLIGTLTGVGSLVTSGISVPNNAYWLLVDYQVYVTTNLAAATTYGCLAPIFQTPVGTGPMTLAPATERAFVAGERPFTNPITPYKLLPPGTQLGVYAGSVTLGTAQAFRGCARYVELRV